MNCKNKIIFSILLLSFFNGTFDANEEKLENSNLSINTLESIHIVTDYLGDFLLMSGTGISFAVLCQGFRRFDGSVNEKKLRLLTSGTLVAALGLAEKLFISFPLNILKNFKIKI